ncbi:MAG: PD-(D/E)XK nuclease family protein [Chloroflexi bacterium]|nr:PD-(D/E)XK nuclease family protein [Chloroflexota bacterium]
MQVDDIGVSVGVAGAAPATTTGTAAQPAAEAPLPVHESYTSLTTYEGCPRRYALRYVERLPGEVPPGRYAFGAAVHHAFEAFVRARIRAREAGEPEPALEVLTRACDEVLERAGLEPAELAVMRAAAGPVLERFLRREAARGLVPVAAELGFGLDLALPGETGTVRFVGYVDRVDRAPDGSTVICDYKTGRPWDRSRVDSDRQLTADPASGEVLPPASRMSLYFTQDGSEAATVRTDDDLAAFERDLLAMASSARRRAFDPRPDPWRCRWCEYARTCADAVTA